MKKSWAAVVRDGPTENRAVATQDTAGAESAKIAEEQDQDIAAVESAKIAEDLDIQSRQFNLVIIGIPYHKYEDRHTAVFDNVLSIMQVIPKASFDASRLGHGSVPMLVKFQDTCGTALESRRLVMDNKSKMKGTPIKIYPDLTRNQRWALPLERKKVEKAREQGLWCELREGVATDPVPWAMRKKVNISMDKGKQVMETTREERRAESFVRGDPGLSDHKGTGIEGDGVTKDLSEHLVEKIIALMPFPSIFKARCLSKAWLARFSSISSLNDEAEKGLAISFQKLVGESCGNWETFIWPLTRPVYEFADYDMTYQKWPILNERSFAYDRTSKKWQKLPSLSFFPKNIIVSPLQIDGALFHGCRRSESGLQLLVINVLTRSWKMLPPIPDADKSPILSKILVSHTLSEYKMVLLCHEQVNSYGLYIYDSHSVSWLSKKLEIRDNYRIRENLRNVSTVYLYGILYMAPRNPSRDEPLDLLAFNIEKGTLESLGLYEEYCTLMVCNGNLLMITTVSDHYYTAKYRSRPGYKIRVNYYNLIVAKFDVESRLFSEGARSPTFFEKYEWPPHEAVSDDNCVFFKNNDSKICYLLAYNLKEDTWSEFSVPIVLRDSRPLSSDQWRLGCFQPGLNPFMAV